jgi:hypothetical protein
MAASRKLSQYQTQTLSKIAPLSSVGQKHPVFSPQVYLDTSVHRCNHKITGESQASATRGDGGIEQILNDDPFKKIC